MNINVPESEQEHFWVEPPAGNEEFWAFRFPPKAQVGDTITFRMEKKPVAEAVISRIEKPGQHECEATGRFKNRWKVYWSPESFKKVAGKTAATLDSHAFQTWFTAAKTAILHTAEEAEILIQELLAHGVKAETIGGIAERGQSQHDIDLLLKSPVSRDAILEGFKDLGWAFFGNSMVSPEEAAQPQDGKKYFQGWSEILHFRRKGQGSGEQKVDFWIPESIQKAAAVTKRITREQAIAMLRQADENGKNRDSNYKDDFKCMRPGPYVLVDMPLTELDYISQTPDREQFYAAVPGKFPPVLGVFGKRTIANHLEDGDPLKVCVSNGNHRCCAAELRGDTSIPTIMNESQYKLFQDAKNPPSESKQASIDDASSPLEGDGFPSFDEIMEQIPSIEWQYNSLRTMRALYQRIADIHEGPDPITVYRAVALKDGPESVRLDGIGDCWAWDERSAIAYRPDSSTYPVYIFQAHVQHKDVDWWETVKRGMLNYEEEIRVQKGAAIDLTGWREKDSKEWFPTKHQQAVTATTEPDYTSPLPPLDEVVGELAPYDLKTKSRAGLQKLHSMLESLYASTEPITIYRAMALAGGPESLRPDGIGVFWSWDESGAKVHNAAWDKKDPVYIFKAQVNRDSVDWWESAKHNLCNNEKELTLIEGAPVKLDAWRADAEATWHAIQTKRTVTAAATVNIRCYHGTRAGDFDVFQPHYRKGEQLGFGIHFATDKKLAERYAYEDLTARRGKSPMVYTVDIHVRRPLVADRIVSEGSPEFELAKKCAGSRLYTQDNGKGKRCVFLQNALDCTSPQRAEKLIREAGFDSVTYTAEVRSMASPGRYHVHAQGEAYLVFDPSQITIVSKETLPEGDRPKFAAGEDPSGLPACSFPKLYHVGSMNAGDKQPDSHEGSGLSVSTKPEAWKQINPNTNGQTWELTKPGNRFVDFYKVTPEQHEQIAQWGIEQGFAASGTVYRVRDQGSTFDFETKEEAERQFNPKRVKEISGRLTTTERLNRRVGWKVDLAFVGDLLLTVYAEDVLKWDGVWWADRLSVANYSAPRGVISNAMLPTWSKRVVKDASTEQTKLASSDNFPAVEEMLKAAAQAFPVKLAACPFWFQPGFDPKVKIFIMSHRFADEDPYACQDESGRWAELLLSYGFDVGLYGGIFDPGDGSVDEGHAWLEVEGSIFDPTAIQFAPPFHHVPLHAISGEYYSEDYSLEGNDLREELGLPPEPEEPEDSPLQSPTQTYTLEEKEIPAESLIAKDKFDTPDGRTVVVETVEVTLDSVVVTGLGGGTYTFRKGELLETRRVVPKNAAQSAPTASAGSATKMKASYVVEVPGHLNPEGVSMPWCVKSPEDGHVVSSHLTKEEAERQEEIRKYAALALPFEIQTVASKVAAARGWKAYAHDQCMVFAIAVHRKTGWPMLWLTPKPIKQDGWSSEKIYRENHRNKVIFHVVLHKPDGTLFDSYGNQTPEQISRRYHWYNGFDSKPYEDPGDTSGIKVPEGDDNEFGDESYCALSADQVKVISNVNLERKAAGKTPISAAQMNARARKYCGIAIKLPSFILRDGTCLKGEAEGVGGHYAIAMDAVGYSDEETSLLEQQGDDGTMDAALTKFVRTTGAVRTLAYGNREMGIHITNNPTSKQLEVLAKLASKYNHVEWSTEDQHGEGLNELMFALEKEFGRKMGAKTAGYAALALPSFEQLKDSYAEGDADWDNPSDQPDDGITDEDEAAYTRAIAKCQALTFPLTVYHTLDVESIDEVKPKEFGVYWSTTEKAPLPYNGGRFTVQAQITNSNDVDWMGTVYANTVFANEEEIRVQSGALLRVLGVQMRPDYNPDPPAGKWQKPPFRSVTAAADSGLSHLRQVGPNKPMGYLPLSTIRDRGTDPEVVLAELQGRNVSATVLPEAACHVRGGALFAYSPRALQLLLDANQEILKQAAWPTVADAFAERVAKVPVLQEKQPELYRLIGLAYADPRFKTASTTDPFDRCFPQRRGKIAGVEVPKAIFVKALDRLNDLLVEANQQITFLCVGGGAMVLAFNARPATEDIDGILSPRDPQAENVLFAQAEKVRDQFKAEGVFNLPDNWINTQAGAIMRGQGYKRKDFDAVPGYDWSNLHLLFANPLYMLAIKCQSLREGKKDFNDIAALIKLLNIRTLPDLLDKIEPWTPPGFIGNEEYARLKLSIAWAFPGETAYEPILQAVLRAKHTKR